VREVRGWYGEQVTNKVALLERILNPEEKEKVVSITDPDARFGHKSPSKTFVGYKVHAAEDSSEIVTSVDILGGNEYEGIHLVSLLEREVERGLSQEGVAADALYDSMDNRHYLDSRDVKAYIPLRRYRKRSNQFTYLAEEDVVMCPAGERCVGRVRQGQGTLYTFSPHQCQACPQPEQCAPLNAGRARVWLSDKQKYVFGMPKGAWGVAERERKRIERKFGEAKQWHGLGRARYWGKAKVAIQAIMTFLVLNTKRMVKLLASQRNQSGAVFAST
jgi:IS5 family transposase